MLSNLSYVSGPSVCLGEVSAQGLYPFFNWVVCFLEWSCVSSLHILEIKPLSEVSLANIFSHTVRSLLILMLFSLAMQKLSILMRSHLFILSFMPIALGDISVKILLCGIFEIFLPIFSSRNLWYHDLYLSLLSILSLFLFMV